MALSDKLKEGKLKLFQILRLVSLKLPLTSKLAKMEIDSALFIDGKDVENFENAVRNIRKLTFSQSQDLTFMIL